MPYGWQPAADCETEAGLHNPDYVGLQKALCALTAVAQLPPAFRQVMGLSLPLQQKGSPPQSAVEAPAVHRPDDKRTIGRQVEQSSGGISVRVKHRPCSKCLIMHTGNPAWSCACYR